MSENTKSKRQALSDEDMANVSGGVSFFMRLPFFRGRKPKADDLVFDLSDHVAVDDLVFTGNGEGRGFTQGRSIVSVGGDNDIRKT